MKGIEEVFDDNLKSILDSLVRGNITGAQNTATELISFCALVEFRDGLFISETLEGILYQIANSIATFEVTQEDIKALLEKFKPSVSKIMQSYKKEDKNELYAALKNMRVDATIFQMHAHKLKPRSGITSHSLSEEGGEG